MAVNKTIAAKVAAYFDSWSPTESARSAENGAIYQPRKEASYFVIGHGDKELPLEQLADPDGTPHLTLVLPCSAVNMKTLTIIWMVEVARAKLGKDGATNLEIQIVGEVDRDSKTKERQYSVIYYYSLKALTDEVPHGIDIEGGPKRNKKNIVYLREILALKLKAMGQFVKISPAETK
jgi:hypothetical protein